MGFNKKVLSKAVSELGKAKAPAKPRDIITDPAGQWKYPGQKTRIPGSSITMQGVNYPVWAQPNVGPGSMMQPGQDYEFPNADYVDETPIGRRGGTLKSKKYSSNISATNKLFAKNKLFKSKKSKIFDPNAKFKSGGSKLGPINLNPNPLSHYELNYGFNLPTKQDGGENEDEYMDLTDEEIQAYRDGGYVVEELPEAQDGGPQNTSGPRAEEIPTDIDAMNAMMKARMATDAEFGNPAAQRMTSPNPKTYDFGNGNLGTHFMASMGNQAVPLLQDKGGDELEYNENPPPSKEDMNFRTPEEAQYFAEHYKEVAPMMKGFKEGGYVQHELVKAQKGLTKKPLEISDPKEFKYRNKMYGDSLSLYNAYQMQDKLMGPGNTKTKSDLKWSTKELQEGRKKKMVKGLSYPIADDYQNEKEQFEGGFNKYSARPQDLKLIKYYKSLGFTDKDIMYHSSPDIVSDKIRPIGTYSDGTASSPIYKKPVQPVTLKKGNNDYIKPSTQFEKQKTDDSIITDTDIVPEGYRRMGDLYTASIDEKTGKVTEKRKFMHELIPHLNTRPIQQFASSEQNIIPGKPYVKPKQYSGPRFGTLAGDENLDLPDGATQVEIERARRQRDTEDWLRKTQEYQNQQRGNKPIAKAQVGLTKKPLKISDPDEYAFRKAAYDDSSTMHRLYDNDYNAVKKFKTINEINNYRNSQIKSKGKQENAASMRLGNPNPEKVETHTNLDGVYTTTTYKKPVQPVQFVPNIKSTSKKGVWSGGSEEQFPTGLNTSDWERKTREYQQQQRGNRPVAQVRKDGGALDIYQKKGEVKTFKRDIKDQDAQSNTGWSTAPVQKKKVQPTAKQKQTQKSFDKNFKVTDKSKYEKTEDKIASEQQKLKDFGKEKGIPVTNVDLENVANQQWSFAGVGQQDRPGPDMMQATPEQSNSSRAWEYITNPMTAAEYAISGGGAENMPHNINEMKAAGYDAGVVQGRNIVGNTLNALNPLDDIKTIYEGVNDITKGDNSGYATAGLGLLGFIPGGDYFKGLRKTGKTAETIKDVSKVDDELLKAYNLAVDLKNRGKISNIPNTPQDFDKWLQAQYNKRPLYRTVDVNPETMANPIIREGIRKQGLDPDNPHHVAEYMGTTVAPATVVNRGRRSGGHDELLQGSNKDIMYYAEDPEWIGPRYGGNNPYYVKVHADELPEGLENQVLGLRSESRVRKNYNRNYPQFDINKVPSGALFEDKYLSVGPNTITPIIGDKGAKVRKSVSVLSGADFDKLSNKRFDQGGITEAWEDELDDYTIKLLRKAGYTVEELD